MKTYQLPDWANQIRQIFKSETVNQFIISGNINDFVPLKTDTGLSFYSLKDFLAEVLFDPIDIILFYNRGKGIRLLKGQDHFYNFLNMYDSFRATRYATDADTGRDITKVMDHPGFLPKAPAQSLELIDRFIQNIASLHRSNLKKPPPSLGVVIDYAHFIAPRGENLYLAGEVSSNLIKLLHWAEDPLIMNAHIINILLTENLTDLHSSLVESPFNAKLHIPLPDKVSIEEYVSVLIKNEADFPKLCEVPVSVLAEKLVGLSRVNIKNLIIRAIRNSEPITLKYLIQVKKNLIEKEAFDRLEFVESNRTLDDVAGHEEAKKWLRDDAKLMKKGATKALPMGYLVTGRIGTGKTFLIECFSGECGVPFVVLKNFREKWVGATEGNLEKIFTILHALGQVVVFVDEADQFAGKRGGSEGDSGLSGRVYGMLAKEMSKTENRGKILWIFATSRPDMLEVDLKRQGRLDVHIPLFPPEDPESKKALFYGMAKKLKIDISIQDLPDLPFEGPISGNELEGLLVRALRSYELQESEPKKSFIEILFENVKNFRPSAHTLQMQLMDLLAVKECTDEQFLPPRFKSMDIADINQRIMEIQQLIE